MGVPPPIPPDEAQRLQTLEELALLGSAPERAYDTLVALAARLLHAPIAVVNLVGADAQWAKAAVGMAYGEVHAREHSFCAHAIGGEDDPLLVPPPPAPPRLPPRHAPGEGGPRLFARAK